MNTITLTDMMKEIDTKDKYGNPNSFDVEFFTYSRSKKTGGEKIILKNAIKTGLKFSMKEKEMVGFKVINSGHHINPAHIRLITRFNNKKVML